jgi:drug/metabolite transporter (DMT)-like permease
MKITTKAHLAVLSTNLFFAANFSMVKLLSPLLVKPFALNVIRVGGSLLLFWILWLFGNTPGGIRREHWGRFFWCALTGVAINQMLFIKGLTLTTTIHAAFLMLVTPLLVTLFAVWVLKEKLTAIKAAGLLLGVSGAVFLILQREGGQAAPDYLLGDLLILVNAVSYALYFILVKPLMAHYTPLHVIRWIFTLGLLMMLPFGWEGLQTIAWPQFEAGHIVALSCLVITGTFLAYIFNAYGLQHIGAGPVGTYIYTQPVFAVLIATFFLNERLTVQKTAAALIIFTGVFLASRKKKGKD